MTVTAQELEALYRELEDPKSWHWKIDERTGWFGHKTVAQPQRHVTETLKELERSGQGQEAQKLWTALTALYHTFKEENAEEAASAIAAIFGVNQTLTVQHEEMLRKWGFPVDDPAYARLKAILFDCWAELAAIFAKDPSIDQRHARGIMDALGDFQDLLSSAEECRALLQELHGLRTVSDCDLALLWSKQYVHLISAENRAGDLLRIVRVFVALIGLKVRDGVYQTLCQVYAPRSWGCAENKRRNLQDLETLSGLINELRGSTWKTGLPDDIMTVYLNVTNDGRFTSRIASEIVAAMFRDTGGRGPPEFALYEFNELLPLMENAQQALQLIGLLTRIVSLTGNTLLSDFTRRVTKSGKRGADALGELSHIEQVAGVAKQKDVQDRGLAVNRFLSIYGLLQARGCAEPESREFTARLARSVQDWWALSGCYDLMKDASVWDAYASAGLSDLAGFIARWGEIMERARAAPWAQEAVVRLTIESFRLFPRERAEAIVALIERLHRHLELMHWFIAFLENKQDDAARRTVIENAEAMLTIIAAREDLFRIPTFLWFVSEASTAQELLQLCVKYEYLKDNPKYWTVQGLRTMGCEICHVTNAFSGGATGGREKKLDPFQNIVTDLTNAVAYQPSCSLIRPGFRQSVVASKGDAFGVYLDYGYIYEPYSRDARTRDVTDERSGISYRTASRANLTGPANWKVEPFALFSANAPESSRDYNEILVRKWTVGGLFYTPRTDGETIERLKRISRQYSYTEQLNGAYFYRKMPFGTPKRIEKLFPVCELDPSTNVLRVVYTPTREEAQQERRAGGIARAA